MSRSLWCPWRAASGAAEVMEAQEQENPELFQRREEFSSTLLRVILRHKEVHPEKFPNFQHELLKQSTPENEARLIVKEYAQRIMHRGVVFLDELLHGTCLHVGIEPNLEALYIHVEAMSEEEIIQRSSKHLSLDKKLKALEEEGKQFAPDLEKLKKAISDTYRKLNLPKLG